jgi:outer membrane immunogenic protein
MKIKSAIAAVLALASASPVLANDISGFRIEGLLGWDSVKIEDFGSKAGFAFGVGAGYDFAVGPTVALGIDGEWMDSSADIEESGVTGVMPVSSTSTLDSAKLSAQSDLYIGARMTGKVADNVTVFGKVGYANANFKLSSTVTGFETLSENLDGFRLGIGAQYLFGSGLYAGAEYRYTNYEAGVTRNQILANVGFRF